MKGEIMAATHFDLYRNERYNFGSRELEEAEFRDHVTRVQEVQTRLALENFSGTHRGYKLLPQERSFQPLMGIIQHW
jgi:hypothetical protein